MMRSRKRGVTQRALQPTVASDAQPLPQPSQDQPSGDGIELRGKEDEILAGIVEEEETDDCSEESWSGRTDQPGKWSLTNYP